MSRTLTRPMFRKGGMAQREEYMGGGIKTVRPKYMGGGMTGIMSGIRPDAGLTPRVGYQEGTYQPKDYESIVAAENIGNIYTPKYLDQQFRKDFALDTDVTSDPGQFQFQYMTPDRFLPKEDILKRADILETPEAYDFFKEEYIKDKYGDKIKKQTKILKKAGDDRLANIYGSEKLKIPDRGRGETEKPKKIIGTQDVTSDKDELQSYMDMFEAAAGSDPDESRRSKYLELAKFGANLLAQPGGDLIGAVGKAAAPSIGGLSKQMESDRDAKRQLRIAGVQAYLKDQDPGSIGKAVKDIMKSDPSLTMKEALTLAMQTGSATKGATKESRIQEYAEILLGSKGAPEDKRIARALAEKIENSGLGFSNFEPLPENPVKDEYYYDKEGKLYKGTEDGVVELNVKK